MEIDNTWQDRVKAERVELNERLRKLTTFLGVQKTEVADDDRVLLFAQLNAMKTYASILDIRIAGFKDGNL